DGDPCHFVAARGDHDAGDARAAGADDAACDAGAAAGNTDARDVGATAVVVGYVDRDANTGALYNAAAFIQDGEIIAIKHKSLLPAYDVFDEARYFTPGATAVVVELAGTKLGLSICEDIWSQASVPGPRYSSNPVADLVGEGAEIILNFSASPFEIGKHEKRIDLVRAQAVKHGRPIVYVNQVGGNDDLIFDGASFAMDSSGRVIHQCKDFEEDLAIVELPCEKPASREQTRSASGGPESIYKALCLGVGDYVRKCGFARTVLGLSGGIDSAVTACIAAAALGAENVLGVAMPGPYSSDGSLQDARRVAENLGMEFATIPITGTFDAYNKSLAETFAGREPDTTEENIQARIRG
ncbi:MAG: NAD(+) synthase, partial [Phycisphaerae bacterium]|nr:NAD(+) synthase [Phycisphaerae bacterium]